MKKWMIGLIATLLITGVQAQTKITGSVKDQKGRILAGASIAVKGSYDGGVSDSVPATFHFKTLRERENKSSLLPISVTKPWSKK